MISRGVFYVVTAILFSVGVLLIAYQHIVFDVPFLPNEERQMWTVEARIEFEPHGNVPAQILLALPAVQPGFTQLSQTTASLGYGVDYIKSKGTNYVEWTRRNPEGMQILYYRADFLVDPDANGSSMIVPELSESVAPEPYTTAMDEIARVAKSKSANPFSLTAQIIKEINQDNEITSLLNSKYNKSELVVHILELSKVHARVIGVLNLENGRRNQKLISRVAVFDGTTYQIFNADTGESGLNKNQLIWTDNGASLLDLTGGSNASVSFTMLHHHIDAVEAGMRKADLNKIAGEESLSLSLSSLPVEEQSLFKNILMLPIGVLIVVFLRIIIGIKTSGTFMPVLIAMSFLETSLVVGLIGFIAIVGVGLVVRSWLSHLNLLLVARISAVIITVIGIIGLTSFFTYQIGLTEGIKVTFFPLIILSWTIERMSILWEEEGYKEVLKQGGGSLFVAVCAYLSMSSLTIQHWTFNFLGLQLVLLALVLVMGNYTGFRLSELKRFKPLANQIREYQNGNQTEHEYIRLKNELNELKSDPHNVYRNWKKQAQSKLTSQDSSLKENNKDNNNAK